MTFKRRDFNKLLGAAALAPAFLSTRTQAQETWSLQANVAECCSCEIPCPCNFGLGTNMQCDGNRLIEIYQGSIGEHDLAGIRFVVTFEMGVWSRICVDENMSESQKDAFDAIFPIGFAGFASQARSIDTAAISVDRQDDLIIKFSTPVSTVEMSPVRGRDGGLITVDGLPYNAFYNYVQYQAVVHTHDGPEHNWSHKGTNGFTSRMIAKG